MTLPRGFLVAFTPYLIATPSLCHIQPPIFRSGWTVLNSRNLATIQRQFLRNHRPCSIHVPPHPWFWYLFLSSPHSLTLTHSLTPGLFFKFLVIKTPAGANSFFLGGEIRTSSSFFFFAFIHSVCFAPLTLSLHVVILIVRRIVYQSVVCVCSWLVAGWFFVLIFGVFWSDLDVFVSVSACEVRSLQQFFFFFFAVIFMLFIFSGVA